MNETQERKRAFCKALRVMSEDDKDALLETLFDTLNGTEWSADTLDALGAIFGDAGLPLADYEGD